MEKQKIDPRNLLSTLWIFILFNMIFRDLHQFANKQFVETLLVQDISEKLVFVFGIILEIPILMVVLPKILGETANRWANSIAVVVMAFGMLSTFPEADLDDYFFMGVEFLTLFSILYITFKHKVVYGLSTARQ
ncbi:MAG: DUF6326 family protein [Bacteroidota bacterium]